MPERCEVGSHTQAVHGQEQYERVTISVHLRCDIDDFAEVLHAVESGKPLLFVDELNIFRQVIGGNRRGRTPVRPAADGDEPQAYRLDIRFDLYGYLRRPGPARAGRT